MLSLYLDSLSYGATWTMLSISSFYSHHQNDSSLCPTPQISNRTATLLRGSSGDFQSVPAKLGWTPQPPTPQFRLTYTIDYKITEQPWWQHIALRYSLIHYRSLVHTICYCRANINSLYKFSATFSISCALIKSKENSFFSLLFLSHTSFRTIFQTWYSVTVFLKMTLYVIILSPYPFSFVNYLFFFSLQREI